MRKIISTLTISSALVAAPAFAALFEDWDTNNDEMLSQEEFTPGIQKTGWFSEWNENKDDVLSQDEFTSGLFSVFDDDNNDQLTQAEWDEGIDAWFGEQAVSADFAKWDDDGNGTIGLAEFRDEIGTLDTYNETYANFAGDDEQVDENEFYTGIYNVYEPADDDDELLSEDEFDPLFGLLD